MILPATAENIARAAELLRGGELVAFPTETVYGLGARADSPTAAARIFEVKERPSFDPLIVHIAAPVELAALVTEIPPAARVLAANFWPGPLTLVLPKSDAVPDIVSAGLPSVAVRMPEHPVARLLIEQTGTPIAAPSANRFGYVSPTTAAHVEEQLGERIPLVLDAGPCRVGLESTIVSFAGGPPALLRPGGITLEAIEALIGPLPLAAAGERPLAPGQLPRHYAPATPLTLIGAPGEVAAEHRAASALLLVAPAPGDVHGFAHVERLSNGDLAVAAARLFAALRSLDRGGFRHVYCVAVEERGLGRAIMDRLRRAAHDE